MKIKNTLKVLARSRSLSFTASRHAPFTSGRIEQFLWHDHPVWYRPGTSDPSLIYNILLKSGMKGEYCPPPEFRTDPKSIATILDIGANIGATSLYFADLFPNAIIHAFEPAPINQLLLERNTAPIHRIKTHAMALGDADGELLLCESDDPTNMGGGSIHGLGVNPNKQVAVKVRRTSGLLSEIGVTAVDIIKIDTEGAEWEILTSMDPGMLANVKLIMGELHGRRDFELLNYLQPMFNIGMRKNIKSRLFNFYALKRGEP